MIRGKFIFTGGDKLLVRGVTYGSFLPRLDGALYPERSRVKEDFRKIADAGLNTVRVYSLPPLDVLEIAEEYGLGMIVGLHVAAAVKHHLFDRDATLSRMLPALDRAR